jgi:hypothetical protein
MILISCQSGASGNFYTKKFHQFQSGVCGGLWCFNATFNIISIILWQSVLLVEETGAPRENHQPIASH